MDPSNTPPELSIVIPVYDGAATVASVVQAAQASLGHLGPEIILVNDGSSDNSEQVCEQLASDFPRVKSISLRRNFGEHNAVMCGLNFAAGRYVAIIDDDMQNPPEEIEKLLIVARAGFDVVYGAYREKRHSLFRNFGSRFNGWVATWLIKKPKDLYLSSFKVMSREVVSEIIKYRGPFPYLDGLLFRVTNNITSVQVEHRPRAAGRSNYTLHKLISLWLNMFLNFSVLPLRFAFVIGMLGFLGGMGLGAWVLVEKVLSPTIPVGYASVFVPVVVLGGLQLMCVGLAGEYIGKQYLDQNGTPQWVVKRFKMSPQSAGPQN